MFILLNSDHAAGPFRRTAKIAWGNCPEGRFILLFVRKKQGALGQRILILLVLDYAEPFARFGSRYSPGVIFMCRLKALVNAATDS